MKRLVALSAAVLTALLLPVTPVAAAGACDTVMVRSYKVSVDVEDRSYRVGDTAKIHLTVIRKTTEEAVPGVLAGVVIHGRGDSVVFGADETDDRGRALLDIKLSKRYIHPGPANVTAVAYRRQVDAYCASVSEYGFRRKARAFRVTP